MCSSKMQKKEDQNDLRFFGSLLTSTFLKLERKKWNGIKKNILENVKSFSTAVIFQL